MEKSEIRPGTNVNIITNIDVEKEITEVRSAIIYDVDGLTIILSQTTPPITKYYIGRGITVTYIVKRTEETNRLGFSAKVIRVVNNYNLYSTRTVQAVILERNSNVQGYDLRMHYRLKTRSDSDIHLYVGGERVNLMDISLGGARFSHLSDRSIEPGVNFKINLFIEGEIFPLEVRSINVWHPSEYSKRDDLEFVSVQFLNMEKKCAHLLSGKILELQRKLRAEE